MNYKQTINHTRKLDKPSKINLLWIGEAIVSGITGNLFNNTLTLFNSKLAELDKNLYGIIGLTSAILTIFPLMLILYMLNIYD